MSFILENQRLFYPFLKMFCCCFSILLKNNLKFNNMVKL